MHKKELSENYQNSRSSMNFAREEWYEKQSWTMKDFRNRSIKMTRKSEHETSQGRKTCLSRERPFSYF